MQHCHPKKDTAGFTLAELLIVVAIVIVLVAIAIPVFTGAMANAEEATCAANRRSIKAMVTDGYLLTGEEPSNEVIDRNVNSLKGGEDGNLCPAKGTYTLDGKSDIEEGSIIIRCSIHGLGLDEEMIQWVQGAFGGSWHTFVDENGNQIKGDDGIRRQYALQNGITAWPSVIGVDGEKRYLEFKSYGNSDATTFLYVGTNPNPFQNNWNADYICDSAGLVGEKGQWYRVPSNTGIAIDEKKMIEILKANEGNKVNLVGDKFEKAK